MDSMPKFRRTPDLIPVPPILTINFLCNCFAESKDQDDEDESDDDLPDLETLISEYYFIYYSTDGHINRCRIMSIHRFIM